MNSNTSKQVPAIVVIAYNRHASLERLLLSINKATFEDYDNINLIISIDHSENQRVREIAEQFIWKHGTKRIIAHHERLGLRKHVLSCGDLSEEYGGVIILEDDLFVSSGFYSYAAKALDAYQNNEFVGGISLYSYRYVDSIDSLFFPSITNGDIFFVRFPSSWGQAWTSIQWKAFRYWLDSGRESDCNDIDSLLPGSVIGWPFSSWKKSFARYLVDAGKYFAYPSISLTTNMGEAGQHWVAETSSFQVPILCGSKDFIFTELGAAITYDQFFELESRSLNILNYKGVSSSDLEFDLYGLKPMCLFENKMVVSSKQTLAHLRPFGMKLIPHELNIIYDVQGMGYHLGEGADFLPGNKEGHVMRLKHYSSFMGGSVLVKLLANRIVNRVRIHIP